MRFALVLVAAVLGVLSARSLAQDDPQPPAEPKGPGLVLQSAHFSPGLSLRESKTPIHAISLKADVNEEGDGTGKLYLNPNAPQYDEYGDLIDGREVDE